MDVLIKVPRHKLFQDAIQNQAATVVKTMTPDGAKQTSDIRRRRGTEQLKL